MEEFLQHELFDAYIRGDLSENEKNEFEQQLKSDIQLSREFKLHQEISQQIILSEKENFIDTLINIDKKHPIQTPKILSPRIYAYAATVAVLIIGTTLFLKMNSTNRLYKSYYSYMPLHEVPSSRGGEIPDVYSDFTEDEYFELGNAYFAYSNKNFADALEGFEAIESNKLAQYPDIIFYISLCHLELEQAEQAAAGFESIIDSPFNNNAQVNWHLALTYLKLNKKDLAKKALSEINEQSSYYQQTQELLSKL